jgi:hypothetical protein
MPKTGSIPSWTMSIFSSAVTDLHEWRLSYEWLSASLSLESYITTDGQSANLSWNKAPVWGLQPYFYCCQTVAVLLMWDALSLWREDRSVVYNCFWPSPPQSFSGPSPVGLATIFYCFKFETSLIVASYDSQGHGGGNVFISQSWWMTKDMWHGAFLWCNTNPFFYSSGRFRRTSFPNRSLSYSEFRMGPRVMNSARTVPSVSKKGSTWLSHLISIDTLSLLVATRVFSSENSAFSFQDRNCRIYPRLGTSVLAA